MNSPLIFFAVALAICGISGRSISEPDNSLQSSKGIEQRDWVKISQSPPKRLTQKIGQTLELECEVTGTPTPTIQWVRGNGPLNNIDDFIESNVISESNPNSLARVRSRLIIDYTNSNERQYTCVGRAGGQIAYATTTILSTPSGHFGKHNLTELLSMNNMMLNSGPKKARVVLYYKVILEQIGSNLVLPCKAVGRPHPEIYWLDNNDRVISGQDPRFKVLASGELLITNLSWPDMGGYTCVARNAISKDAVSTFVYPVLNEEEEEE